MKEHKVPVTGQRGPRVGKKSLPAIGLMIVSLALVFGVSAPASASPTPGSTFPTAVSDCRHGGWADFSAIEFSNQVQCARWVRQTLVNHDCPPDSVAGFLETGPTYAAQLGIPLGQFLTAVCPGQDFPVSNASYVVNNPAGTELLSLASGNTTPFVTQPGHIYWIQVQGAWNNGPSREVDAGYISDDAWASWANGPEFNPLNLQTQINDKFVDWGTYNADHNYSYWVLGDGNPINMRVFDGDPATNTPNTTWYADNIGLPVASGSLPPGTGDSRGMPAIVFEYTLPTP